MQEKYELDFPVLSDVGNVVARPLGIVWTPDRAARETQLAIGTDLSEINGPDEQGLPMPAVLLVDRDPSFAGPMSARTIRRGPRSPTSSPRPTRSSRGVEGRAHAR